ncbi:MAG: hypothetical protein AAGA53_10785, partial [Pseudomonadota bacterium]
QLIKNHKVFTEEHPYNERHPNKDLTSVVRLDLVRRINKKLGTNLDVEGAELLTKSVMNANASRSATRDRGDTDISSNESESRTSNESESRTPIESESKTPEAQTRGLGSSLKRISRKLWDNVHTSRGASDIKGSGYSEDAFSDDGRQRFFDNAPLKKMPKSAGRVSSREHAETGNLKDLNNTTQVSPVGADLDEAAPSSGYAMPGEKLIYDHKGDLYQKKGILRDATPRHVELQKLNAAASNDPYSINAKVSRPSKVRFSDNIQVKYKKPDGQEAAEPYKVSRIERLKARYSGMLDGSRELRRNAKLNDVVTKEDSTNDLYSISAKANRPSKVRFSDTKKVYNYESKEDRGSHETRFDRAGPFKSRLNNFLDGNHKVRTNTGWNEKKMSKMARQGDGTGNRTLGKFVSKVRPDRASEVEPVRGNSVRDASVQRSREQTGLKFSRSNRQNGRDNRDRSRSSSLNSLD